MADEVLVDKRWVTIVENAITAIAELPYTKMEV